VSQFDDDIDTMLSDFDPVTLVFGPYSGTALRDVWDQEILPGPEKGVVVEFLALMIRTSAFPGLKVGSEVVVDGVPYIIRDRTRPIQDADGALTHLLLAGV
jgi:hypothetical protein